MHSVTNVIYLLSRRSSRFLCQLESLPCGHTVALFGKKDADFEEDEEKDEEKDEENKKKTPVKIVLNTAELLLVGRAGSGNSAANNSHTHTPTTKLYR